MARPARSLLMARKSVSALLAAVEIGNKTASIYQEETFCLLLLNSWEILLKARVVQLNDNRIEAIFRRWPSGRFRRSSQTEIPLTIGFVRALNLVDLSNNARANLLGLRAIRNDIAHLGILSSDLRTKIRSYGSASIVNFCKTYSNWFGEPVTIPYLLPLAFIGETEVVVPHRNSVRQRELLAYLSKLGESPDAGDADYAVTLHLDASLTPLPGGGGTIGITSDPNAPEVQLSDTQLIGAFPWNHRKVVDACKDRYSDFRQDAEFRSVMRQVKSEPSCAYQRKLDPENPKSPEQWRYHPANTLKILDSKYRVRQ